MAYMLYLDEAGCTGILSPKIQPAFCMLGLIAPLQAVPAITRQFLELKREFNPSIAAQLKHDLDIILYEVKGSSLKRDIRSNRSTKGVHLGSWIRFSTLLSIIVAILSLGTM